MKYFFTALLIVAATTLLKAQHSGNVVYGDNSSIRVQSSAQRLYLTDSTFIVKASVLMNVVADSYVVTFAVADSAATLQQSNSRVDKRISGFTGALSKFDITQNDFYVDMTTQNKVYDYHIKGNTAEQYIKGFEIQKNVIIRFRNIKDLDKLIIAASAYQIYDLVKVDYIVTDLDKIQTQLFGLASEVISKKKDLYVALTNIKLLTVSEIYLNDFNSFYPTQLYKTYSAKSSSNVYSDYSRLVKKDLKEAMTVYYDKISYAGFDRVVNPVVVEPAVEFVMALEIKFQIDRSKK